MAKSKDTKYKFKITNDIALREMVKAYVGEKQKESEQEAYRSKLVLALEEIAVELKNQGVDEVNGLTFRMELR